MIGNELSRWWHSWFDPLLQYATVAEWWAIFFIILFVASVIAYFADFKWVKAILGIIVLIAGAFVAGGTAMFRHMRKHK